MYTLLTEQERQVVASEYSRRRLIVMLVAFIIVTAIGIVGLFPSYILSNARNSEVQERIRIMGDLTLKGDEAELQEWLSQLNLKLQILSPKLDTDRPSFFIEKILELKIAGVHFTNLSWTKDKEVVTISLAGIAQDRQILIALENRLNNSGLFSAVVLPVSNLARDKDIDFQVKLFPIKTP